MQRTGNSLDHLPDIIHGFEVHTIPNPSDEKGVIRTYRIDNSFIVTKHNPHLHHKVRERIDGKPMPERLATGVFSSLDATLKAIRVELGREGQQQ